MILNEYSIRIFIAVLN